MVFKAVKPDSRILILQIIVASILGFSFHSEFAVISLFLVIDFLLFYWYGVKVFIKRLLSYLPPYPQMRQLRSGRTASRIPGTASFLFFQYTSLSEAPWIFRHF